MLNRTGKKLLSSLANIGRSRWTQRTPPSTLYQTFSKRAFGSIEPYQAGLISPTFSHVLDISKSTPSIPIYRVLNFDGTLVEGVDCPFTKEEVIEAYKFMSRLAIYDDYMYNIQRQGRVSFYMQNQGEEATQLGVAIALSDDDTLWCQYRELGVLMWRGFTLPDALNQLFSNSGDPGKGRQMPISYTKKEKNILTISTPLTTQVPHASGAGYAHKLMGEKNCAVAFFGEGAASEGDFHAAMNFAATLKSQTLFVCRNNGYAISTPVEDQYAGDGIAIRGIAYGMETIRVDGNDLFAVFLATQKARQICVNKSEPVCLELMTYRMGHHSTSDDSAQYRNTGEQQAWEIEGVLPIGRIKNYMMKKGWWDEEEHNAVIKEAKATVLAEIKIAEKRKCFPIIPGLFDDVYAETVWNVEEQKHEFSEFMKDNQSKYDLSRFPGLE